MTSAHGHPDFANVIRVARFHQAPQRAQFLGLADRIPDNVVVLPLSMRDFRRMFARGPGKCAAVSGPGRAPANEPASPTARRARALAHLGRALDFVTDEPLLPPCDTEPPD